MAGFAGLALDLLRQPTCRPVDPGVSCAYACFTTPSRAFRRGGAGDGHSRHGSADLRGDRGGRTRAGRNAGAGGLCNGAGCAGSFRMGATPPGESHGAAGAAGAAQCSDFDGRRLYVHGRLLRPAIRDKPVSAAAAGPLGAGNRLRAWYGASARGR
ncbi:hypothetical protein G6F65_020183 [Rhizopus arrhizus]|nr:hypothetical protein G6F65_020183 [Rhizopus arrhizus]